MQKRTPCLFLNHSQIQAEFQMKIFFLVHDIFNTDFLLMGNKFTARKG